MEGERGVTLASFVSDDRTIPQHCIASRKLTTNDENGKPGRIHPRRPEEPVYSDDTSVEVRDTNTQEARGTGGVGLGTGSVFLLLASAVFVIIMTLTDVADSGGDAPQGDEVNQFSPQVETPSVP